MPRSMKRGMELHVGLNSVRPRLAVEVGGAVEESDGLRHIVLDGETTYCGETLRPYWPRVAFAVERSGFWCRGCLDAVARSA